MNNQTHGLGKVAMFACIIFGATGVTAALFCIVVDAIRMAENL